MSLYKMWSVEAYDMEGKAKKRFWDAYTPAESKIYEGLLASKTNKLNGTVTELAERFKVKTHYVCGFLDGIREALNEELDVKELDENSVIDVSFEFEALLKKMVEYKADRLYNLPQWDHVIDPETRQKIIKEQKNLRTVFRSEEKTGRNDPCPCGSGKKYKKCCGA